MLAIRCHVGDPDAAQFVGTSIFERLKQVQNIKSAVMRTTLDGMYHQNHRQRAVVEGQANIDDLLSAGAKPGGIIRVKSPHAIQELGGNFFSGEALQLLSYVDTQKDQRVGVNPNGTGRDQPRGERFKPRCRANDDRQRGAGEHDGEVYSRDRTEAGLHDGP